MRARPPGSSDLVVATMRHARKDSNLRRLFPVLETGALAAELRACGVRGAGEIGIEPMASCVSDRRSTHAELLADSDVLGWTWPGSNRPPPHCKCGALPTLSYRPMSPHAGGGYSITPGAGVNSPQTSVRTLSLAKNSISNGKKKGPSRAPADRVERIQSDFFRNSTIVNNHGASVPPLRAGERREEMEARVDCGDADPPCVCALMCGCSGTRWWKKESNPLFPRGSRSRSPRLVP